jgi:hypothetical protein
MAFRIRLVTRVARPGDGAAEDTRRGARRGLSRPIVLWIIVYLTGGLLTTLSIDTPGDGGFGFAWRYLLLPIAVLSVYVGYRRSSKDETPEARPRRRALTAIAVFVTVMIGTPGYVMLVNSVAVDGEPVTVEGPIVEKWSRGGRTTSYHLRIRDERTGKQIKLQVSYPDYKAATIGTRFSRTFFRGRLGLLYRWKL